MKGTDFEIVAGNRRCLACKGLGWRKMLCHIVELDDKGAFEVSLIENIQRRTLNPIEEACAFNAYVTDFGWGGVSELSRKIGKSISYVDRRLGLLSLPTEIQNKIICSTLSGSVAQELIPVNDENTLSKLADVITKKHLSVKQARKLISKYEDSVYDSDDVTTTSMPMEKISELDRKSQRSFDKSIIAFKVAMKKMADIMENVEDNWVVYEILMHHRNALHAHIDLLIKEKKKT